MRRLRRFHSAAAPAGVVASTGSCSTGSTATLVDVERWTNRDELCYALEAPVWDRFGSFAGQPEIAGTVVWTTGDRRVVIEGRRGDKRFEEVV